MLGLDYFFFFVVFECPGQKDLDLRHGHAYGASRVDVSAPSSGGEWAGGWLIKNFWLLFVYTVFFMELHFPVRKVRSSWSCTLPYVALLVCSQDDLVVPGYRATCVPKIHALTLKRKYIDSVMN